MTRETNKFTFNTDNDNDKTSVPMENWKKRGLTSNSETSECSVHSLSKREFLHMGLRVLCCKKYKRISSHISCVIQIQMETPHQLQYTESVMQRDKSSMPQPTAPDKLPVQQEVACHSFGTISSLNSLSDRFSFNSHTTSEIRYLSAFNHRNQEISRWVMSSSLQKRDTSCI